MKKAGFYEYAHGFSVGYGFTAVGDILNIHKYLKKKYGV